MLRYIGMLHHKKHGVFAAVTVLVASVIFTMLSGIESIALAQGSTCPIRTGVPYRSWSRSSVFYITPGCQRQPIKNPGIYFSYFTSWNDVQFTSDAALYSVPRHPLGFLPWGPRRRYENGTVMKTVTEPTVYILSDGRLHPIASETVFSNLHLDWSWVEDVSPDVITLFPKEAPLYTNNDYPDAFVFKYPDQSTVYALEKLGSGTYTKSPIDSYETLQAIYRPDRVAVLPATQTFDDVNAAPVEIQVRPSAPANLRATDITRTSISFRWFDRSSNETSFVIERREMLTETDYRDYTFVPANTNTYTDTGVLPRHTYRYRLRAINGGGRSSPSTPIEITAE